MVPSMRPFGHQFSLAEPHFDSLVLVAVYLAPQLVEFFTALPNSGEGLC